MAAEDGKEASDDDENLQQQLSATLKGEDGGYNYYGRG
jgi:hypothetical protein